MIYIVAFYDKTQESATIRKEVNSFVILQGNIVVLYKDGTQDRFIGAMSITPYFH